MDSRKGADPEAELISFGIEHLRQGAQQLAESQAAFLLNRAGELQIRQRRRLSPRQQGEVDVLTSFAAAAVGGGQTQGGVEFTVHPGEVDAQKIVVKSVPRIAIAPGEELIGAFAAIEAVVQPVLITSDDLKAEAELLICRGGIGLRQGVA